MQLFFLFFLLLSSCNTVDVTIPTATPTPLATPTPTPTPETPEDFTVAFLGDQGLGSDAVLVLQLIASEGADMVIHSGDFEYTDDPDTWDNQITGVLGANYPYFASIGNHDVAAWSGYQAKLQTRLNQVTDASCTGDLGVQSSCVYQGLFFILSGVGTSGSNHETYLTSELAASNKIWKICSWHKNQQLMQVGGKTDEVGWDAYEICREAGAIIATAHEHSYSRTHLLSDMENQVIVATSDTLALEPGNSFVFVSGLGGDSIRAQTDALANLPHWAAVYSSTQNANYGALFCKFNYQGIENQAYCYFKDIDGDMPDEFFIESNL